MAEQSREARAQRILDAAATLILRWGYNKVTIDDISRLAGVAKGTIYLHWKSRESLFRALMLRERVAMFEELQRRVVEDPDGSTLHAMLKHSALVLMNRPLLKAALLLDIDVLGKLASSEQKNVAYTERVLGFKTYLEFLREHGLVRTDLSVQMQVYILSAVFMGFFLVAPLMPDEFRLSDEEMAEMISETIYRTLELGYTVPGDETQPVARMFHQYLKRTTTLAQQQLQKELES